MRGQKEDLIVVESERAGQAARTGVIEEVLQEQPARFRVRWDDGHTSIFSPSAGAARIVPREHPPVDSASRPNQTASTSS